MPLYALDKHLWFPPVDDAMEDGLLAMGGDLSIERLLFAYTKGIFPWYDGNIPLWWCPNPRFVLFPHDLKISKSMRQLIKRNAFTFTVDRDFRQVIHHCKNTKRPGQQGTWITAEVERAYTKLHEKGIAQSAEAWLDNKLVGGLYGIRLGKIFFGESMFSHAANASKFAFISYVQQLTKEEVQLIDCQVYTEHLESLGAQMINRSNFIELLEKYI